MARWVKVSSIGAPPPPAPKSEVDESLVDSIIAFWRNEIAVVLPEQPDLIVLPELCDRFSTHTPDQEKQFRQFRGDRVLNAFREMARDHRCYIAYSSARAAPNDAWLNSTLMIDRRGELIGTYYKNHAVVSETTDFDIICGTEAPLIECDFGTVAIAICFDLNFDELRLQYKTLKPDLILYPSLSHCDLMEPYWAHTCRAHFVSCQGVANLPSKIYSPVGHIIASSTNHYQHVTARINLDCVVAHLDGNWEKLQHLKNRYGTNVSIFDPGYLGSVLISSESETVSATSMARDCEIELLDNYIQRSRNHHRNPKNLLSKAA
jgi:predicted amidohydrolase